MKLRDYLKQKKLTIAAFAELVDVHQVSAARYLSGDRFPDHKVLARIKQVTKGKVSYDDFCPE